MICVAAGKSLWYRDVSPLSSGYETYSQNDQQTSVERLVPTQDTWGTPYGA